MAERIEKAENEKIDKMSRSNRNSFSFQPVDCFCNYKVRVKYDTTLLLNIEWNVLGDDVSPPGQDLLDTVVEAAQQSGCGHRGSEEDQVCGEYPVLSPDHHWPGLGLLFILKTRLKCFDEPQICLIINEQSRLLFYVKSFNILKVKHFIDAAFQSSDWQSLFVDLLQACS